MTMRSTILYEGNRGRRLPDLSQLNTNSQHESGLVPWVPAIDYIGMHKYIHENGTYKVEDEPLDSDGNGIWAYTVVNVNVAGGAAGEETMTEDEDDGADDDSGEEEAEPQDVDPADDGKILGKDPDTGEWKVVEAKPDGTLEVRDADVKPYPTHIQIVLPPSKLSYYDGEAYDFRDIEVIAYAGEAPFEDNGRYPNGLLPYNELTFNPSGNAESDRQWATSDEPEIITMMWTYNPNWPNEVVVSNVYNARYDFDYDSAEHQTGSPVYCTGTTKDEHGFPLYYTNIDHYGSGGYYGPIARDARDIAQKYFTRDILGADYVLIDVSWGSRYDVDLHAYFYVIVYALGGITQHDAEPVEHVEPPAPPEPEPDEEEETPPKTPPSYWFNPTASGSGGSWWGSSSKGYEQLQKDGVVMKHETVFGIPILYD